MTLIKAERTENSTVELEFSVDRETFDKEVSNVYRKQAANITVPGFRKGKALHHRADVRQGRIL